MPSSQKNLLSITSFFALQQGQIHHCFRRFVMDDVNLQSKRCENNSVNNTPKWQNESRSSHKIEMWLYFKWCVSKSKGMTFVDSATSNQYQVCKCSQSRWPKNIRLLTIGYNQLLSFHLLANRCKYCCMECYFAPLIGRHFCLDR